MYKTKHVFFSSSTVLAAKNTLEVDEFVKNSLNVNKINN